MLTTKVHSLVTASFSLSPCFKQATFSLAVTDGLRYCRSPLTPSLRELGASRRAGVFARAAVALGIRHKHTLTHKILTCGISPHLHFNTKKPKKPQNKQKKEVSYCYLQTFQQVTHTNKSTWGIAISHISAQRLYNGQMLCNQCPYFKEVERK